MLTQKPADILLVEDNPNDVQLALYALELHAVAVDVVRTGPAALDYFFANAESRPLPKLVLLDLKLPMISGLELITALKQHPLTHTIPIVVLTTSQEERDVVASYRGGANSYMLKPTDFDQFTACIQALVTWWLKRNQLPRPNEPETVQ